MYENELRLWKNKTFFEHPNEKPLDLFYCDPEHRSERLYVARITQKLHTRISPIVKKRQTKSAQHILDCFQILSDRFVPVLLGLYPSNGINDRRMIL